MGLSYRLLLSESCTFNCRLRLVLGLLGLGLPRRCLPFSPLQLLQQRSHLTRSFLVNGLE